MGIREYLSSYGTSYNLPDIAGLYSGCLIICGDSHRVWRDLEFFGCKDGNRVSKDGWHFMTVNKIVEVFPGNIDHAYSNNASCLQRFIAARRDEYREEFKGPRYTHSLTKGCDFVWPFSGHGTSGLGAALVAVALGYRMIVLCGMPLDDGPHNGEPPWRTTGFTKEASDRDWARAKTAFEGKVRSMSGRTKDWLGDALEWV
jgi:hypothetical protein